MMRTMMMRLCVLVLIGAACSRAAAAPPNIVFILADDLGWSDVRCYGGQFADTPHLDRLASQGMRFTQAYAPAPICSASRGAFLTGRSPARIGLEFVVKRARDKPPAGTKLIQPPFTLDLPHEEVTIAETLKPAGYATACIGKWHLNEHYGKYLGYSPTHGPHTQGFDESAEDRGSHPYGYEKKNPPFGDFKPGEYAPDSMTQNAIDFVHKNKQRPFFLYASFYYVHDPVHTRCRWLFDKYRARAAADVNDERVTYGAFVETLDHHVGQLLAAIDKAGVADNTLVVFTSDNGGHQRYTSNAPLRAGKWTLYEGGVRVPMIVRWPGVVDPGAVSDAPVIGMDLYPTFAEAAGVKPLQTLELDGWSLIPLLRGGNAARWRDRTLYWHFPYYHEQYVGTTPISSIRIGNDKLIYFYEDAHVELFDLGSDLSETRDLSTANPSRAAELRDALMHHLESAGARFPKPRETAGGR